MCAYYVPDAVRRTVERMLDNGITSTPVIAGKLHTYEFAVEVEHRLGVVDQIKDDYREANPAELYDVEDEPLSDDALEAALETTP